MPGTAPPRSAPLWILALITFSGTMAMHIFVPALPQAGADLGVGPGPMQATVSVYVLGLALGQLVYGPVSDRWGRRPVLVAGLALYTAAGAAAVLAPGIGALVAARLFQALGGCAGLVLGRAIVRDGATETDAARRLALMNLMVVLGPGIAPLLGAGLAALAGWRAILAALCALGVLNLVLTCTRLPETRSRSGVGGAAVLRAYAGLLRSPAFLGFALGGGCATTSLYAFVAAAPYIFVDELHRPASEVALYLALNIVGLWLGSLAASRLAGRVRITRLLVAANLLSLAGAALFLAEALSHHLTVPGVLLAMMVFSFGAGIASPAALAEAMAVNPRAAGSASGFYGFLQMAVGALCTLLAGLGGDPARTAAVVLVAAGLLAQAAFALAIRRRRPA